MDQVRNALKEYNKEAVSPRPSRSSSAPIVSATDGYPYRPSCAAAGQDSVEPPSPSGISVEPDPRTVAAFWVASTEVSNIPTHRPPTPPGEPVKSSGRDVIAKARTIGDAGEEVLGHAEANGGNDPERQVAKDAAGKLTGWLIGPGGKMMLRDEHVEVFSRFVYPAAYSVCIGISTATALG